MAGAPSNRLELTDEERARAEAALVKSLRIVRERLKPGGSQRAVVGHKTSDDFEG